MMKTRLVETVRPGEFLVGAAIGLGMTAGRGREGGADSKNLVGRAGLEPAPALL